MAYQPTGSGGVFYGVKALFILRNLYREKTFALC